MRLGSRASALALAQARLVADLLGGAEIVPISTAGDRDKDARFDQIGDGRGVFTRRSSGRCWTAKSTPPCTAPRT